MRGKQPPLPRRMDEELNGNGEYGEYGEYGDPHVVHDRMPDVTKFPVAAMPRSCRALISETAAAIGCPPDFAALPMIVTLGSAIGNARVIKLKEGWEEGPAVYGVIVAEPGEKKSPAAAVALEPAVKVQAELKSEYQDELDEHKRELREYEVAKRDAAKDGLAAPPPPEPPSMGRTLVEDTTVEALAVILEGNPRGVQAYRDELSAFVRAMDQYKAGGKGSDRQFFLSAWSNRYASVDRKTRSEPLILPRPFVGVFGSIQPAILPEIGDGREDGLLDRFLYSYPDPLPSRWTDDEISPETRAAYRGLYGKLRKLHMPADDHGEPDPVRVLFAPDAKAVFVDAVNQHREEMDAPGFPARLKGPWSKLEAYLARISLILALSRCVEDGVHERVEPQDVLAAVLLIDYFKTQARRVYVGLYGRDPLDDLADDLKKFLDKRKGSFRGTPTELHEQLASDHKPKHPKDLTRYAKKIADKSPSLSYDDGKDNVTKEGKRTTQNYVELRLLT